MYKLIGRYLLLLTATLLLGACSLADAGLPDFDNADLNRLVERTDAVSSGDVVLYLLAGEQLSATKAVEVTAGKRLVLRGFKEAPARIVLGKEGFVVGSGLELENVEIDASALCTPLIVPSIDAGAAAGGGYFHVDDITLRNVKVSGLPNSILIAADEVPYSIEHLVVESCTLLTTDAPGRSRPVVSLPKGRVGQSRVEHLTITPLDSAGSR